MVALDDLLIAELLYHIVTGYCYRIFTNMSNIL